jgi:alkanesulfonate monooxygenase SsuD/methylene tetrahydromethanopterin reductase-like flavin-dependent oxidoreductase (luciferase family)
MGFVGRPSPPGEPREIVVPGGHDDRMTTLGAIFLPQTPPDRLRAVARAADQAGLDELWLWEDCFLYSGVAAMTAALAWTDNLKVGIGILPLPFRNPAITAMEIATMHRLFGERAIVGLGHGVQEWMGQVGARPASPLTLMREYVTALRQLLAGEEVTTTGRYVNLDHVRLDWPPANPPALLIGATGPKTLRLSGELAAGTILTGGTSPEAVRAAIGHIAAEGHRVIVFVPAATGPGAAERAARQQERWKADDPGVSGSAAEIAAGVRRWTDAGADTVVLQPLDDEPDPEEFVRFTAEEVKPLLA